MIWGGFFNKTKAPVLFMPPGQRNAARFIKNIYKKGLQPLRHIVLP
jgi:hypothetical protein